jgi:hypothetical protein
LRIEDYFAEVQKAVDLSPIVRLSNVTYEKRGTHEGIIKGRVDFVDSSVLEWREYVDVEAKVDCLMYVYHYMDSSRKLIFRYDNTGHHKKLAIPTYPHHKHLGRDENVVPSEPRDLKGVLQEIESMVELRFVR